MADLRRAIAVLSLLILAGGTEVVGQNATPPLPAADGVYRIQAGDQLEIKFFYNPMLNEQLTVRPDGRLSLQLIGELVAAGLTPAALTAELMARYAVDLQQPEVTVIVRGFASQRVFVDGEVARPGVVAIVGVTTALQAVAEAGGIKDSARQSEVLVIRRGPLSEPTILRIDLKKMRAGRSPQQDITLEPFDILFVPRSRMANVNLWVDQYIRKNIPVPFGLQYGLIR